MINKAFNFIFPCSEKIKKAAEAHKQARDELLFEISKKTSDAIKKTKEACDARN